MGFVQTIKNLFKSKSEKTLEKHGWTFMHYGRLKELNEKIYWNDEFPEYVIQILDSDTQKWRLLVSLTHLPPEHLLLNDLWSVGDIDDEWINLINSSIRSYKQRLNG